MENKCRRCCLPYCSSECRHDDKSTWQEWVRAIQILGIIFVIAGCRNLFGMNKQPEPVVRKQGIGRIVPYDPPANRSYNFDDLPSAN